MNGTGLIALTACALVAGGLYGVVAQAEVLRKIVAFNILGAGVFLLFGVIARRGAGPGEQVGLTADPVPQAMVITGLVVAFAATALALVLTLRLYQITGAATVAEDPADDPPTA